MTAKGADPEPSALVEPEVVAELTPLQEKVSSRPTKVEELHVETLVDLPVEPTLEIVPPLAAMRASFFLRSPDVYNPLQIFLHKTGSQEIDALVCELVYSLQWS